MNAVLYFTAPTCQPCKRMAPIIDSLAEQDPSTAWMLVDVTEQPDIAADYEVTSVPTFIKVEDDKPGTRVVGAFPRAVLTRRLDLV